MKFIFYYIFPIFGITHQLFFSDSFLYNEALDTFVIYSHISLFINLYCIIHSCMIFMVLFYPTFKLFFFFSLFNSFTLPHTDNINATGQQTQLINKSTEQYGMKITIERITHTLMSVIVYARHFNRQF